jgi:hypothetical protein
MRSPSPANRVVRMVEAQGRLLSAASKIAAALIEDERVGDPTGALEAALGMADDGIAALRTLVDEYQKRS